MVSTSARKYVETRVVASAASRVGVVEGVVSPAVGFQSNVSFTVVGGEVFGTRKKSFSRPVAGNVNGIFVRLFGAWASDVSGMRSRSVSDWTTRITFGSATELVTSINMSPDANGRPVALLILSGSIWISAWK